MVNRLRRLEAFIKFLEDRLGYKFDVRKVENLKNRFALQKYVFLARFFGLDLGYRYSLHIYGPYSPELADDYFSIERPRGGIKLDFKEKEFVKFVKGRSWIWLEIASTILHIHKYNKGIDKERLLAIVKEVKHNYPPDKIEKVFKEVNSYFKLYN